MLSISNMCWSHKEFDSQQELMTILANRMSKLKLATNMKLVDKDIVFNDVEAGQTFRSQSVNKIMLRSDDPRIEKFGRNYLQTKRPSKEQYYGFFNTIQDALNKLGLSAEVRLITKDKKSILLRNKKTMYDNIPAQKSYPMEK